MVLLVHIVYRILSQDAYHVLSDTRAFLHLLQEGALKELYVRLSDLK